MRWGNMLADAMGGDSTFHRQQRQGYIVVIHSILGVKYSIYSNKVYLVKLEEAKSRLKLDLS